MHIAHIVLADSAWHKFVKVLSTAEASHKKDFQTTVANSLCTMPRGRPQFVGPKPNATDSLTMHTRYNGGLYNCAFNSLSTATPQAATSHESAHPLFPQWVLQKHLSKH
jgi:hypothetical protein